MIRSATSGSGPGFDSLFVQRRWFNSTISTIFFLFIFALRAANLHIGWLQGRSRSDDMEVGAQSDVNFRWALILCMK
jgi:hypothetical protein